MLQDWFNQAQAVVRAYGIPNQIAARCAWLPTLDPGWTLYLDGPMTLFFYAGRARRYYGLLGLSIYEASSLELGETKQQGIEPRPVLRHLS